MKAKRILWLLSFMFFASVVFLPGIVRGDAYHDKIIDDRINSAITTWLTNPGYDPHDPDPNYWIPGKVGYALAALHCDVNTTLANTYINDLCTGPYGGVPRTGFDLAHLFGIYFYMPEIWRMHLSPDMNSLLTSTARSKIRNQMFNWILNQSKLTDANSSVWYMTNSENHDALEKSCSFLACQALDDTNSTTVLGDGSTIDKHLKAWNKYFFEYFRQRAREGLNSEIASIEYNIITLKSWYNIRDFAKDPNLRSIANDCISLFWADYANDFSPATGLRGASGTRWYKPNLAMSPATDSLQYLTYAYGWQHTNQNTLNPDLLAMAISSYRIPDVVRLAGATAMRSPYISTTRRFGKGTQTGVNTIIYHATFDANNAAHIRRDTCWTNNYVMSGLSERTDSGIYCQLNNQNRATGVFFAGNLDDRIVVDGNGNAQGKGTGYAEITSVCGKNCLVAAWDKNATNNTGVNIFLAKGPLATNLKYDASGWIFTQTGPYNAVGRLFVASADANDPTWNNELLLGDTTLAPPTSVPQLTTGGGGYGGGTGNEAIRFVKSSPAVGNVAYATMPWQPDNNSVSVDLYFKSSTNTDSNEQILATVPNIWQVSLNINNVRFSIWNTSGSAHTLSLPGVSTTRWQHLTASANKDGYMQLSVDTNSATPYAFSPMKKGLSYPIVLGNKPGYSRWYNGLMDNVYINCPNMSCTSQVAAWKMNTSYSKDVYAAIKIANGGYKEYVEPWDGDGNNLTLLDKFSPIVVEVNSAAANYSFTNFKNTVIANNTTHWVWDGAGKHLTYTSLAGTQYEYWGNSGNLPKINGVNINLNPNKTYDGPSLQGYHGMDAQTISYPGQSNLVLNFNYITSPNWDDYQTVALWHMDSIASNQVADDHLENSGRNNYLTVYGSPGTNNGPISTFSKALTFNGTTQYGQAATNWASYKTVKVDLWFYTTRSLSDANNQVLVAANNTWNLSMTNGYIHFDKWYGGPPATGADSLVATSAIYTYLWYHCTATIDATGLMAVTLTPVNPVYPPVTYTYTGTNHGPMTKQSAVIQVGNKSGYVRWFKGLLDDIKITQYSTP